MQLGRAGNQIGFLSRFGIRPRDVRFAGDAIVQARRFVIRKQSVDQFIKLLLQIVLPDETVVYHLRWL